MSIAVLLLCFGSPSTKDEIKPFLYNLFSDTNIFPLPFAQKLFARLISETRARSIGKKYDKIGGGSPYNKLTFLQSVALQRELAKRNGNYKVFVGFLYCKPFVEDVLNEILCLDYEKIILLPLYPQYSFATTRAAFSRVKNKEKHMVFINDFHNHPLYIKSVVGRINDALQKLKSFDDLHIVFTAHNIPRKMIEEGDTYEKQVNVTVHSVFEKLNKNIPYHIAYQSKVGFGRWLTPSTEKLIEHLKVNGAKRLVMVPISFVCEHFETLYQVGVEYRNLAMKLGYEEFVMTEALNDSPDFIQAIADIVEKS